MSRVRGRYAPSPTGDLHLGNARTALLAWLSARAPPRGGGRARGGGGGGGGALRHPPPPPVRGGGAAAGILESLRFLGLDWDEGPDVGGPHAPYLQSERTRLYDDAVATLLAAGRAFPCFCSRAEVAAASQAPHAGEEGPRYPGTCRVPDPDREARVRAQGRGPSIRFRVEPGARAFDDVLMGPQAFDVSAEVGDFVVRRADGIAAYQLAVVVDDAAMEITEVVRGADLLSSTPRQLLLYEALARPAPRFLHVPLVLGPDGARLAKRHGAASLTALAQRGEDPARIAGFLAATAGLCPFDTRVTPRELLSRWDIEPLPRGPFSLDPSSIPGARGG